MNVAHILKGCFNVMKNDKSYLCTNVLKCVLVQLQTKIKENANNLNYCL